MINNMFKNEIMSYFTVYSNILNQNSSITAIFGCAYNGTGDYYICGLYLDAYLKKNNINSYIFLVPENGSESKVVDLFPVIAEHKYKVTLQEWRGIRQLRAFVGIDNCMYIYLHHQIQNLKIPNITNGKLMGFNGLEMIDFYLYCGFRLPRNTEKHMPTFSNNDIAIQGYFEKHNLKPRRTVLISPYSAGLKDFLLPNFFWENLATTLKEKGFSVCCNCSGTEKPIEGTTEIFIPYKDIVPFLDMAGFFIGIRSGLCDIISTAKCKKIVVHTYKAKFWPYGNSIPYTGLNHMRLCNDAVELEYKTENDCPDLQDKILKVVK